jgi:hypothetical protein
MYRRESIVLAIFLKAIDNSLTRPYYHARKMILEERILYLR